MRALDDITQSITLTLAAAPTTAVQYTGMYCEGGKPRGFAGTIGTTDDQSIAHDHQRRKFSQGKVKELTVSNPSGNSAATVTVKWRDDGPDPDQVLANVLHRATIPADGSLKYTEAQGWQLFTAGGLVQAADDWYAAIAKGDIPGHSLIHQYGRNPTVASTGEDLWTFTNMVWASSTFTAEVLSGSASDTAAGTGAQQVTISGLDANWAEQTETFEMNGTIAVIGAATWARVNRAWVSRVGTYHNDNVSNITVRVSVAGSIHVYIRTAEGQAHHGAYTIPAGKTGYLLSADMRTDDSDATMYLYQYAGADDTSTPFAGSQRIVRQFNGLAGQYDYRPRSPLGPFAAKTDLWWRGKPAATADMSVDFELLLVDD